jgi:phosphoadenosine phosphosulfate reductase
MEMTITKFEGHALRLTLVGDLDISGAKKLALPLRALSSSGSGLVVDMTRLDCAESIGVWHLVAIARTMQRSCRRLVLLGPNPRVIRVLLTAANGDSLPIVQSEQEARVALDSSAGLNIEYAQREAISNERHPKKSEPIGCSQTEQCNALYLAVSDAGVERDLMKRVATIRSLVRGRIVFTTSFGIEDQAITHAILHQALGIDIVTLDTGRLFPETYEIWAQTERRYGQRIAAFYPDRTSVESLIARQGIDGFYDSVENRQACCAVRKVESLRRALVGATAWITGLRIEQSAERAEISFATFEHTYNLVKVHPLFDYTREQVVAFVRDHSVPYNVLHDCGFPSIGCAPCTRAVTSGEPERAGRWWWEHEEKKECGLHRRRPLPRYPARSETSQEEITP